MSARDYKMAKTLVDQKKDMRKRNKRRVKGTDTADMTQRQAAKGKVRHYS